MGYLRGRVMRLTRLDRCGRPMYGDCNQVVTDGFITVTFSPEVEEGEGISVTKANGRSCVAEAGEDALQWYNVEIEFCDVNPYVVGMFNPRWKLLFDAQGRVIGYEATDQIGGGNTGGVALELWMDKSGGGSDEDDVCSGEGAQGEWGYFLLPLVRGGTPGDVEITNDAVTFPLTGRARNGSRWRRGPYPVQIGENGAPGPLLEPVATNALHRLMDVTVPPPEPEPDCQPVERPVPDPADLTMTGVANDPDRRTVRLRADNHGFGRVLIDWGDGTPEVEAAEGVYVNHLYAAAGTYTVRVRDKETPAVVSTRTIVVPLPADTPALTLSANNPADRMEVTAHVVMPPQATGEGTIDWGDGTEPQEFTVGPDGSLDLVHVYAFPGVYPVMVRRADVKTFRVRQGVAVPVPAGPLVSIAADPSDPAGRTALLTWDSRGDGAVTIEWGDGTAPQTGPDAGTSSHAYATDGERTVTVTSRLNSASRTAVTFTVPLLDSLVASVAQDAGDPDARSVALTVDNQGHGAVVVDWGDGSAPGSNPGTGTATTHKYASAGTYYIQVRDVDPEQADRSAFLKVTVPFIPPMDVTATKSTGDPDGRTVQVVVDNKGQGEVTIEWGDGLPSKVNPGDGVTSTTQTYTVDGEKTITVIDSTDSARTGTATFTIPFP